MSWIRAIKRRAAGLRAFFDLRPMPSSRVNPGFRGRYCMLSPALSTVSRDRMLIRKEELMGVLEKEDIDILATFGAGNIDRYTTDITEMMQRRYGK